MVRLREKTGAPNVTVGSEVGELGLSPQEPPPSPSSLFWAGSFLDDAKAPQLFQYREPPLTPPLR